MNIDKYVDIKVINADQDVPDQHVMSKVVSMLHLYLNRTNTTSIGMSFPNHSRKSLGTIMRLHGNQGSLQDLLDSKSFSTLHDYVDIGGVESVPDSVKHQIVSRKQASMTPAKLRRLIKRGNTKLVDEDTMDDYIQKMNASIPKCPFAEMKSATNGHKYRLSIHQSVHDESDNHIFNHFGLSVDKSTVPMF